MTASKRYAKAFYELADEKKLVDKLLQDMQTIKAVFDSSADLLKALVSPIVNDDNKLAILTQIFSGRVSKSSMDLIKLLSERGRLGLLGMISTSFGQYYNLKAGILEVDIRFARNPEDGQLKSLIGALEKSTGKKIMARKQIDDSLIGGVQVQIQDTIIDGSVKNKLTRMAELLHAKNA